MADGQNISDLFDLTGKVAIVTGAGSGLGIAFAEGLAEAGASVVCADLNEAGAQETARRLEAASGRPMLARRVDVTDEASVDALIAAAVERFGRLDVMVNNAGIGLTGDPETFPLSDWKRVIDVNLTGVFLGARSAARAMEQNPDESGGSIINVASILGFVGAEPPSAAAYAASKGGVVNLTRDLSGAWAKKGIRVNAIGPAYFPSAMTQDVLANDAVNAMLVARTQMGRLGRPDELKGPVVFLASRASSYVTGHTLLVDGGWVAW